MNNRQELAPGIFSYENVIPDPASIINRIESYVSIGQLTWQIAEQASGGDSKGSVYKSARDCFAMSLPSFDKHPELKNQNDIQYQLSSYLDSLLLPTVDDYRDFHGAHLWKINEGWQLLKYGEGNHFVNHYDDSLLYPRTVSMSFYLNDDYDGGEIEFTKFNLKIKPKANQMVLFPSSYIYRHTVHPVTQGTRYAIVGWWN